MTYGIYTPIRTKKPPHKRWWFWVLVIFGSLVVIGTIAPTPKPSEPSTAPTNEAPPPATESPNNAAPEPTPEKTDTSETRFDIYDVDGTVTVDFQIRDAITKGQVRRYAQADTLQGIQQATNEYPNYEQIAIVGWFPTVDDYGNEKNSQILVAYYSRETVEKINFDGIDPANIFKIRDSGEVHPNLER